MGSALPDWVTPLSWVYIGVSLLSAAVIAADIHVVGRRQESLTTGLVWITSALYLGPLAIPAYLVHGRASAPATTASASDRIGSGTAVATLPGGGASAVAHLVAVPLVAAAGWTIAGMAMWPMILVIAVLAVAMLTAHELAAPRTRRSSGRPAPTGGGALLAAVVTVAAFDVGMVGWMLVLHVNDLMPAVTEAAFWFLMQVGVIVGLATGYPAVAWLTARRGTAVTA